MQSLPQEIIDRLVDELSDSPDDLKNLCFLGYKWLSRCRTHLFQTITLAPKDLEETYEYELYVRRRSSMDFRSRTYYHTLSARDRAVLHSAYARGEKRLLSSIPQVLPYIKGLYIDSRVRIGGGRSVSTLEYFTRWLGMGDEEVVEESYIMRSDALQVKDFFTLQQERLQAVNLPFGPEGLHSYPFTSLRYLRLQWGIFSWMPFNDQGPSTHPARRFTTFLQHVSGTLNHLAIDDYPGFDEIEKGVRDFLVQSIAQCAPGITTLSLGGLVYPNGPLDRPTRSGRSRRQLHDVPHPIFADGRRVPGVTLPMPRLHDHGNDRKLCLERLFVRGFGRSTVFVEDAILNSDRVDTTKTRYLALSAMEPLQEYTTLFRAVGQWVVHLTLDVDASLSHTEITPQTFPLLQTLQLIIRYRSNLAPLLYILRSAVPRLPRRPPHSSASTKRKIHLSFPESSLASLGLHDTFTLADDHLYALMVDLGWLDSVTMRVPDGSRSEVEKLFPKTFGTNCWSVEETDEWWFI